MVYIRRVLFLLLVVIVIILIVQNFAMLSTPVTFKMDLIFVSYESSNMPLSLIVVIAFFVGVLALASLGIKELVRSRKEINRLKREAKQKDMELNSLRNLPVTAKDMNTEPISEE